MSTLGFFAKTTSGKKEIVEVSYKGLPILLLEIKELYWRRYNVELPSFVKVPRYLSYRVFQSAIDCTKDLVSINRQPYLVNIRHTYVGE